MTSELQGKTIAILASDGVEQVELKLAAMTGAAAACSCRFIYAAASAATMARAWAIWPGLLCRCNPGP